MFPNKNFVIRCKKSFLLVRKYTSENKINIKPKHILSSSNLKNLILVKYEKKYWSNIFLF